MPHEWISTLATLALSVLVLSTVTFTTQQYVFSLEETLAEDQLQDIADEIASKVIEIYRIGRQSSDATASEPLRTIASTRLQPQARTISGSPYQIVLNNSTGSVEIYLVTDPDIENPETSIELLFALTPGTPGTL